MYILIIYISPRRSGYEPEQCEAELYKAMVQVRFLLGHCLWRRKKVCLGSLRKSGHVWSRTYVQFPVRMAVEVVPDLICGNLRQQT